MFFQQPDTCIVCDVYVCGVYVTRFAIINVEYPATTRS